MDETYVQDFLPQLRATYLFQIRRNTTRSAYYDQWQNQIVIPGNYYHVLLKVFQ